MTGHNSDLAHSLTEAREAAGLSILQLAVNSGLNPRTIERIEKGEVDPHPATRRVLSLTLDVPVETLFVKEAA